YEFGPFRLDTAERLLLRNGRDSSLRRQARAGGRAMRKNGRIGSQLRRGALASGACSCARGAVRGSDRRAEQGRRPFERQPTHEGGARIRLCGLRKKRRGIEDSRRITEAR